MGSSPQVSDPAAALPARALVAGLGRAGQALVASLRRRGVEVTVVDDQAGSDQVQKAAAALRVEVTATPEGDALVELVAGVGMVCPSPGIPPRHPVFAAAGRAGVPMVGELDLAAAWTDRPMLAVTGTDGKTTVTTLVADVLCAAGRRAVACGNNELPLVEAIDADLADVLVVEASSFRLYPLRRFAPDVGTWLNFSPDHLDWHPDLHDYAAAKARIWAHQRPDQVAVANAAVEVVARAAAAAPGRVVRFGGEAGDYRVDGDRLVGPAGELARVAELPRRFPHDLENHLAVAATTLEAGAPLEAVRAVLTTFRGFPHRLQLVGEAGGVRYYDDSKATTLQSVKAGLRAFESLVLIAGGRNKGLDLSELAAAAEPVRAVVAIGEAAADIAAAFEGRRPVEVATSMDDAVRAAAALARPGDSVLLSPACTSYDWYRSYAERGDDFARAVREHLGAS